MYIKLQIGEGSCAQHQGKIIHDHIIHKDRGTEYSNEADNIYIQLSVISNQSKHSVIINDIKRTFGQQPQTVSAKLPLQDAATTETGKLSPRIIYVVKHDDDIRVMDRELRYHKMMIMIATSDDLAFESGVPVL